MNNEAYLQPTVEVSDKTNILFKCTDEVTKTSSLLTTEMRRELKATHNYCSWEAGGPGGNKGAWILNQKKGPGPIETGRWNSRPHSSHSVQTQGIESADYL